MLLVVMELWKWVYPRQCFSTGVLQKIRVGSASGIQGFCRIESRSRK